jgi:hypothetical protein
MEASTGIERSKLWIRLLGITAACADGAIVAAGAFFGRGLGALFAAAPVAALAYLPYGLMRTAVSGTGYAIAALAVAITIFVVTGAANIQLLFFPGGSTDAIGHAMLRFVLLAVSALAWGIMAIVYDRLRPRWR